MTFYVYVIDKYFSPYDSSYMTLPGFTPEEVEEVLKKEGISDTGIALTGPEAKKLFTALRESGADTLDEYMQIYDSMKSSFVFEKYLSGGGSKISYSFWVTGASDGRTTIYAVGADTVGAYDFNLTRIAKKLGERNFYQYFPLKGKRIQHFSSLISILKENRINTDNLTEEKLIKACQEDKYFILQ